MAISEAPWSILYSADGQVFKIGPFDTEKQALDCAKKECGPEGELDIEDQYIYLLGPDHRMVCLYDTDLE